MGLRCSLLGHDYGSAETERDREERGDEVVITTREVETCARCGEAHVISESTEVTAVAPAPDSVAGDASGAPDAEDAPGADAGPASPDASASPGSPEEAGAADAPGSDSPSGDATPGDAAASPGGGTSGNGGGFADDEEFEDEAVDDDAVILDDNGDAPADRDAGEWPDADDTRLDDEGAAVPEVEEVRADAEAAASESGDGTGSADADESGGADGEEPLSSGAWPDPKGEDEGFDATPDGDDEAVAMDGMTPEAAGEADEEPVVETPVGDPDTGRGFVTDDAAGADDGPGGELACPNCGFSEALAGSSHRSGDICPSCRKGYLAEQ